MLSRLLRVSAALITFTVSSLAANITGTVTNKTNDKPSAGDDVVLLKLAEGMQEAARTKSDARGKFSLQLPDDGAQHLVRVTHQGVNYFKPAPAGTTTADIDVYDASKHVDGVTGRADIMRVQAHTGQMEVTELFVLQNDSKPPRAQMSERSFEITLPEGAVMESSLAAGPGGMPVNSAPVPTGDKNHYAYVFPIRPGETKFQISYHTPYSGNFDFKPQILIKMDDVVVMLPKNMQFNGDKSVFTAGGQEKGLDIYVAHNVTAGKQLAFTVSGTGEIPREAQADGENPDAQSASNAPDNRPGGGLGRPEETPDALHAYKWWILGGLAAALAVGAIVVINQKPRVASPLPAASVPNSASGRAPLPANAVPTRNLLLEALKEELFQLETDHLQGKISESEYQQAKAALDLTMKRALSRGSQQARA